MSKHSKWKTKENAHEFPPFTRTDFVAAANALKATRRDSWSNETADETMNLLVALAIAIVNWQLMISSLDKNARKMWKIWMIDQGGKIPLWVFEAAFAVLEDDFIPFEEETENEQDNETSNDDRHARQLTAPNSLLSH
jgi:hypothetical protein